jgi:hypothetical protein
VFVDYMIEHTRRLDLDCLTTMPVQRQTVADASDDERMIDAA